MKYFDSHAHYYDERFSEELDTGADELIGALLRDSVSYIINVGTSPETSRLAIEQAKKYLAEEAKAQGIYFIDKHALFSQIDHVEYVTEKDKQRDEDVAQLHTSNQIGVKALEASEGKSLSKLYQPSFYDFGVAEESDGQPKTYTEDTTTTPSSAPKQDDAPTQK